MSAASGESNDTSTRGVAFLCFYRVVSVAYERRGVAIALLAASLAAIPWSVAFGGFRFELGIGLWPFSIAFALPALVLGPLAFRAARERRLSTVLVTGTVSWLAAVMGVSAIVIVMVVIALQECRGC